VDELAARLTQTVTTVSDEAECWQGVRGNGVLQRLTHAAAVSRPRRHHHHHHHHHHSSTSIEHTGGRPPAVHQHARGAGVCRPLLSVLGQGAAGAGERRLPVWRF
jgi:hypothetical protein